MKFSDEELTTYLRWQGLPKDFVAADRIEQLVKERDESEQREVTAARAAMGYLTRAETAEAKLAKAVEALGEISSYDKGPFAGIAYTARTLLAELEVK